MAKTQSTTVHHLTGKRLVGIDEDGFRLMIDGEAEAATGMRPMMLLLNAVGGCAAMDILGMIHKRRLEVNSYRIELEGVRPDDTPSPFERIRARHVFDVPGLDRKMAERFVGLGMTKYCSVSASLNTEIEYEVVLEHEEGDGDA